MSCDVRRTAREIFDELVEHPAEHRSALLAAACAGDARLKARVEQLLAADARAEGFLQTSIARSKSSEERAPALPAQIGRYHIQRVLASGGMGTVYEAVQEHPRRAVAVKVMRAGLASRSALRRFEYESQLLARLRHPGIAQVYESGTHDAPSGPVPYFAMEYIPGARPITAYALRNKLGIRERLALLAQACDAVHHGHQKGIIHRDLKPSNVLVDAEGYPKIIDFGVARAADSETVATALQTQAGQLIGTLQYMSPEQCAADPRDLDTRSDVYALGLVLYELLSGKRPYDVTHMTLPEATRAIREDPPSKLSALDARLGGDLETIVQKALEKDRDRRYRSAAELADDLRRYLAGEAVLARPPSIAYQLRVFSRRHKALVGAAAAVIAALVLGIIGMGFGLARAERQRLVAERARGEAETVTRYLTDTIGSLHPNVSQGRDPTVREMLRHIEQKVDEDDVLQDASEAQATLRTAIGNVYVGLNTYEPDAERHLAKALEIRRGLYGESHPKVAESLYNLAKATRWKQGSKSKVLYLQALAIQRTQLGETHVDTIATVEAIANLRLDSGDYEGAREMYEHVLRTKRAAYGEDHPEVAGTLSNLASLYADSENLDQAKPLYERALAIQRKHFAGRPHLKLAGTLFGMGGCAMSAGECREAEVYLRECDTMVRQLVGGQTPWSGHIASRLGSCLLRQGQFEEARRCFQRAVDIYTSRDGDGQGRGLQMRTQGARRRLADCLTRMGRYEEAEAQLTEARSIASHWTRRPGNKHRHAILDRSLAGLYDAWGKPDEAAEWLGRAEAQFREALEGSRGGGFATALCRSDLGECLAKLGRFAEAERELLEARRFMTSVCRKHQCVQDALERLAALYDAWDKPDKAAEYRTLLAENKRL